MATCRDCFFAITIAVLVGAGTVTALQSGLAFRTPRWSARLLGNCSKLGAALIGGGFLLAMIQDWMGYRMGILP